MSEQIIIGSHDVTSYIISYRREDNICTSLGVLTISLSGDCPYNISFNDVATLYENGNKVCTCNINTISRLAPENLIEIVSNNGSDKLNNCFLLEKFEISDTPLLKTRYWIEKDMTLAGVPYEFTVGDSDGEFLPDDQVMGATIAMDEIKKLLQYSGWFMRFSPEGVAIIGNLDYDSTDYQASVTDSTILNIKTVENDNFLRNRIVVWGMGNPTTSGYIFADLSVNTAWNYDVDDVRSSVISNGNIEDFGTATSIASKALKEFTKQYVVKTVQVAGFLNVHVGDRIALQSNHITMICTLTNISSELNNKGRTTTLVLDERCPRLIGYMNYGGSVYIGTHGSGIWSKYLRYDHVWRDFSTGLYDLDIKDLHIANGIYATVTEGGDLYYMSAPSGQAYWIKVTPPSFYNPYQDFYYSPIDAKCVAVSVDPVHGDIIAGYNMIDHYVDYSGGPILDATSMSYLSIIRNGIFIKNYEITLSGTKGYRGNSSFSITDLDNNGKNTFISSVVVTPDEIHYDGSDDYYIITPDKITDITPPEPDLAAIDLHYFPDIFPNSAGNVLYALYLYAYVPYHTQLYTSPLFKSMNGGNFWESITIGKTGYHYWKSIACDNSGRHILLCGDTYTIPSYQQFHRFVLGDFWGTGSPRYNRVSAMYESFDYGKTFKRLDPLETVEGTSNDGTFALKYKNGGHHDDLNSYYDDYFDPSDPGDKKGDFWRTFYDDRAVPDPPNNDPYTESELISYMKRVDWKLVAMGDDNYPNIIYGRIQNSITDVLDDAYDQLYIRWSTGLPWVPFINIPDNTELTSIEISKNGRYLFASDTLGHLYVFDFFGNPVWRLVFTTESGLPITNIILDNIAKTILVKVNYQDAYISKNYGIKWHHARFEFLDNKIRLVNLTSFNNFKNFYFEKGEESGSSHLYRSDKMDPVRIHESWDITNYLTLLNSSMHSEGFDYWGTHVEEDFDNPTYDNNYANLSSVQKGGGGTSFELERKFTFSMTFPENLPRGRLVVALDWVSGQIASCSTPLDINMVGTFVEIMPYYSNTQYTVSGVTLSGTVAGSMTTPSHMTGYFPEMGDIHVVDQYLGNWDIGENYTRIFGINLRNHGLVETVVDEKSIWNITSMFWRPEDGSDDIYLGNILGGMGNVLLRHDTDKFTAIGTLPNEFMRVDTSKNVPIVAFGGEEVYNQSDFELSWDGQGVAGFNELLYYSDSGKMVSGNINSLPVGDNFISDYRTMDVTTTGAFGRFGMIAQRAITSSGIGYIRLLEYHEEDRSIEMDNYWKGFSGFVSFLETTNQHDYPFIFVATVDSIEGSGLAKIDGTIGFATGSGLVYSGWHFWQKDGFYLNKMISDAFVERSYNLPQCGISVIRVDDLI